MANLTKIVKISWANYQTLKNGGSVSGQTYDPNAIYLIEDNGALDIGDGSNLTADMKAYLLENPGIPVIYNGAIYYPTSNINDSDYVIYTFLTDDCFLYYIGIRWDTFTLTSGDYELLSSGLTKGAILYGDNYNTASSLLIGSAGQVLKVVNGLPAWANEYSYTLPLAANGTRGGIQTGYTATGANIPLQLSNEKAYVALTSSAITSALGRSIGVANGSISIYVNFPTVTQLINAGYLRSDYESVGYPIQDFLKAILKWSSATYVNLGTVTLMGQIAPSSTGTCIISLYSSADKDSSGNPRYASGQYLHLDSRGGLYIFGNINYNWYFKTVSYTDDLNSYLPLAGGVMTGAITLNNGISLNAKNSNNNAYSILYTNSSNNIIFGNSNFGGIFSYNHIYPISTDTYNLGTSTAQWNSISGRTIYENGTALFNKYVLKKDGSYFYNYVKTFTMYSSNAGTFKITLPTPEAGTTAAWYMMSFEVIWQRPYNDSGVFATNKMLFNYYVYRNTSGVYLVYQKEVYIYGTNVDIINVIKYDNDNPFIIYIRGTSYVTLTIQNLSAMDSATSLNFNNTTIESVSSIPDTTTSFTILKSATQTDLGSYLPLSGGTLTGDLIINAPHRDTYYASNLCRFLYNGTPTEYVIKTKIRYVSSTHMPVVRIYGYAYGLTSPIELRLGFYIYGGNLGWCGAVSTGAWQPEIYLFKYTENSIEYVAIGFKGSCYFCGFQVDAQIGGVGSFGEYFSIDGWSTAHNGGDTSVNIIPAVGTDNCVQVPYRTMSTSISGSATSITDGTYSWTPTSLNTKFGDYLPLSGGTLTGALLSSSHITLSGDSNSYLFIGNGSGTGVQFNNDKTIRILVNGASSGTLTLPAKTGTLAITDDIFGLTATADRFSFDLATRKITNTTTRGSWDSQVYSNYGHKNDVYVSFRAGQTSNYIMAGLDSDPATSSSYNTIDYCWYIQQGGTLNIYESGTSISVSGHTTYAVGDEFRIEYSNGQVRYYHNGTLCRTVTRAVGNPLQFDSSFYNGGYIFAFEFGIIPDGNFSTKAYVDDAIAAAITTALNTSV